MPSTSKRVCNRCRQAVGPGRCPNCTTPYVKRPRKPDTDRPSAAARGYDRRWREARAAFLKTHPYCECDDCLRLPEWQRPVATDVNHIDGLGPLGPRGYDRSNWQAMAHGHHSRLTAREHGGFGRGPARDDRPRGPDA